MFTMAGLTQYIAVIIILLSSIYHPTNCQLNSGEKEKINTGLSAGEKIADCIGKQQFSEALSKIGTSIAPYLGALGPVVGLIFSFIPSESAELQYMKKMMKNIDNRFDRVDSRFDSIERQIKWSSVKVNFGQIEQKIRVMSKEVKYLYKVPQSGVTNRKKLFIKYFDNNYQHSGAKLYDAVMLKQGVFTENICASVMKYTENDRKKTQDFMLGILRLLMEAAKIEITDLRARQMKVNEEFITKTWTERLQKVRITFQNVDRSVRDKYHSQSGRDVSRFATENKYLSNRQFARKLSRMLEKKYYWRKWLVVAYKELRGYDNHCVSVCGGYIRFRTEGRNILVASVPSYRQPINKMSASLRMRIVPVTHKPSWWSGYKKRRAKDVYNSINKSGACSVGVIKRYSDIHYASSDSRRFVLVKNRYYDEHMWG